MINTAAPKIIAEIGCNHKGDMEIAKEMIKTAAEYCKADIVKFQKRCNKELLSEEEYNAPHPNPHNSYGDTYGAHREFLEFNLEQHRQLQKWCEEFGIEYSTSVWDVTSAKEIVSLNPKLIKVPSACNLNKAMLEYLCDNYQGEIHLSFGMTDKQEEENIVKFFEQKGRNKDLVIYACTSGYPVPFEDICLLEITRLREQYENRVKAIGFSGHHLGIAVDSAAVALGAEYIERHFTLDRTWKGTDHAASLEPDGVRKLCRDCRSVKKALTYKSKDILDIESVQRNKLKKNQIRWDK
ncbi:MAG: N-acetylneuraminate synthase family protein [Paludibacteraceae bacterium]|nr:N-acetylneuraminate synthase family protein [Paludibacteraceae bacterium]